MAIISVHFYPTFFLLQLNLTYMFPLYVHSWSQSKLSFLSPLIIGSNIDILRLLWPLTANYKYIQPYSWSPQLLYVYNIKPKLDAKQALTVRE